MNRRESLKSFLMLTGGMVVSSKLVSGTAFQEKFPVRALTGGPKFHWFGYYDKLQFDPTGRYVLGCEVNFEHRSPMPGDEIRVGMVDLHDNDRWIDLGSSRAWSWQQGCMLQWVPGSSKYIMWNDLKDKKFVSHRLNVKNGKRDTFPKPVYALSPDGTWAIGTEFSRIDSLRPGYGYAGIPDPYESVKAPKEIGLYKMSLKNGNTELLFSLAELAEIPHKGASVANNFHWFNHLLINTDGTRFNFLHRWRSERTDRQKMASGGFTTRMFTASPDGKDLYCIDPSGFTSHFIWRDPSHMNVFTKPEGQPLGFYIIEDRTGKTERIGAEKMPVNGHQTYLSIGSGKEWILCDNYANSRSRLQTPYLYHVSTGRRINLGDFNSPEVYTGEWRCDLHPRSSHDGKMVCIDSPHGGNGRQLYLIDISSVSR